MFEFNTQAVSLINKACKGNALAHYVELSFDVQ